MCSVAVLVFIMCKKSNRKKLIELLDANQLDFSELENSDDGYVDEID
jgi:hypothetical protein